MCRTIGKGGSWQQGIDNLDLICSKRKKKHHAQMLTYENFMTLTSK